MQGSFLCHNSKPMNGKAERPPPAAVSGLVRRFRAQRPLRGGSLLITLFGDAIAARGGAVTLGSLIRLAAPFGLTERLVRTSVARLARESWLTTRRSGRRSEYRLTRSGARRFAAATRRIYAAQPHRWHGVWTLVLLRAGGARQMDALRRELKWLGFGQLTPLLFAHPACSQREARRWLRGVPGARAALLLQSASGDRAVDRRLAARGWDLKALSRRYRRFIALFAPLEPALTAGIADEVAFVLRTLLIHEYRKIHLQDPLLPPALLPPDWVGTAAYRLCRRLYARVFAAADGHLSASARQLHRSLPAVSAAARARFGGIAAR